MQDCPNRRSLAVNDEAAEDDNSPPIFDEDPSEKGITISAEEGELLMTRHILNIDPILEDDWYHKRIFRTHGTVVKYVMSSLMVEVVRMWCLKL